MTGSTRPLATPPEPLLNRLEGARATLRRYRAVRGGVRTALAAAVAFSALVAADWAWELATPWRAAGLAAVVAGSAGLAARLALRPARSVRRDDAAAEVEAGFPALGQRVRTALEYAEPGPATAPAAPGLVDALEADAERKTRGLDLRRIAPWGPLVGPSAALGAVALLGASVLLDTPEARTALLRALLLPAHYSTLTVRPGDRTVKVGSDFTVEAVLSGRPVARVRWLRRPAGGGPWVSGDFAAPDGSEPPKTRTGTLAATWAGCQEDADYRVVAGNLESPVYRLKVIHPLTLKGVEARVTPPRYTRVPAGTVTGGDLSVIEGSAVRLTVTIDRAPASAELRLSREGPEGSAGGVIPLEVRGSTLTGSLAAVKEPFAYRVWARAADGMELEARPFAVRVRRDGPPTVRFVRPAEELAVVPTTEVGMAVEAGDDFGVSRVGVVYRVNDGPEETLEQAAFAGAPLKASVLATLYLEKHPLTFADSLSYYAFAEDNRPGTPQRTTTELRYIDILPFRQDYQISDGGACQGNSVSLGELIARQRGVLGRTFARSGAGLDAGAAARLAGEQRGVLDATTAFTRAFEAKFGPEPALGSAAAGMREAAGRLDGRDAGGAVAAEETALAGLVKAKKTMRKLLSQKASAGQCRSFDRGQQQALRTPPKKPADPPKVARSLRSLAEEERKIDQALCRNPGRSASSLTKPGEGQSPAGRQEAAAKEAERIGEAVRSDPALTDLARERMADAAAAARQAAGEARAGRNPEAAAGARETADRLDRLAEQVEALKAPDLAARLAAADALARGVARQERDLADRLTRDPGPGAGDTKRRAEAGEQRGLAERAKTLGDWLGRFQADAAEESRPAAEAVRKAGAESPPAEAAAAMARVAEAIEAGKPGEAGPEAARAADQIEALAQGLDAARRALAQPQLDRLVAAEARGAKAQEALRSARDAGGKAQAEKAVGDLLRAMEGLAAGAGRKDAVAKAAEALAGAVRSGGAWGGLRRGEQTPGDRPVLVPPGAYTEGVQQALRALQSAIQEVVLRDALQDRDEAVPPRYRTMVDDYYRTLSEDLR